MVVCICVGVMVLPTLTDTQLIVPDPLIVHARLVLASLLSVIAVVTESTIPEFTLIVPEVLLKARELQVRFPSTVKVKPAPTVMSSPGAGMVPPGQGAFGVVELQLPLPVVVTGAENPGRPRPNKK